ncbi:AfsR/SARP family transcriptional regulator [Streptomyces tateyamensis]|uniref:AfsR/SARP family transcriptional regulator n=1 Tax=Streptomyces tateyamensis TaxID=565073 RepID=UPI0011B6200A|nr:BTAD domain-containing putative transcriptional regulator [Streptomyces tateyamensis]
MATGGRRITVGGARQRTILALLLLAAGRIVSVDTMVEAVWQGDPPATARTQVAICIAALRKTFKAEGFGEDLISTAHPGYQLDPAGHEVDLLVATGLVHQGEQLVEQGATGAAAERYEQALRLWRGPVLAGVTGRRVEEEAERLEEWRLVLHDEAIALQLALGNHQELIGRLTALVREHPLRERTRHSLMLAQYRAGRRAEALETFRDGRQVLIEELGIEPGPALHELHDAVLRDDAALTLAVAQVAEELPEPTPAAPPELRVTPSDLPPNVPAFTGRGEEIAEFDAMLTERRDDEAPAIGFVTGVAGVGKTGLAVHWAHRAAKHFPDGRLFVDLCGHDEANEPVAAAEVLSRFLRSLGVPAEQIPPGLEERVSLYRSMLADRRLLVVLDNVRSVAQIRPLLPANGRCCVVVTSRDPMEQLMLRYGAVRVQLAVLPPPQAIELLARIVPAERIATDPEQSARLAELCDHLPLALRIAAARLASKPHWTVRHLVGRLADERRRLDELSQGESQVRAGFALSYRYLSFDAAQLYRRLALLPVPDFAVWVGAALLDCDQFEAERLVEHLVDVQLLEAVGSDATGQLRYRFQNLLRLFARERATQEEPEEQLAGARDRALRAWLTIAAQAHDQEMGGPYSVMHGDTPRYPVDPDLVADLLCCPLNWFEAERLGLVALVDQAAGLGEHELAWDLAGTAILLFDVRNYAEDWEFCCQRALTACRQAGNEVGASHMLSVLGASRIRVGSIEEGRRYLESALEIDERTRNVHCRAMTINHLARADRLQGHLSQAATRLREAAELYHRSGDRVGEAQTLGQLSLVALATGEVDEAVRLASRAVQAVGVTGETRTTAQATYWLGRAHAARGELQQAARDYERVLEIVRAKGDLLGTAHILLSQGELALEQGELPGARAKLLEALELGQGLGNWHVCGWSLLRLGGLERDAGDLATARHHYQQACELLTRADSLVMLQQAERALAELSRPAAAPAPQHSA